MKKRVAFAISALMLALVAWRLLADRPADHEDSAQSTPQIARQSAGEAPRQKSQPRASSPAVQSTAPQPAMSTPPAPPVPDSIAALPPLRAPIIQAIRAGGKTPEEKRASMLRAIEESGASQESWTDQAQRSFDTWRAAMPENTRRALRVGPSTCFRAGCVVEVSFTNEAAYQEAARAFRTITESAATHGGRVQTPPATQGGKVIANWIMLRPESAPNEDDA